MKYLIACLVLTSCTASQQSVKVSFVDDSWPEGQLWTCDEHHGKLRCMEYIRFEVIRESMREEPATDKSSTDL